MDIDPDPVSVLEWHPVLLIGGRHGCTWSSRFKPPVAESTAPGKDKREGGLDPSRHRHRAIA
jgi:hypothetical protein